MSDQDPDRSTFAGRSEPPTSVLAESGRRDEPRARHAAGDDWGDSPIGDGLPAGYRMRHDAHYVEALSDRAAGRPLRLIPIDRLKRPGPPPGDLGPLTESIRSVGLLQPLLVRPRDGRYEVLAGNRRLAAAAAAELREVPCLVEEVDDLRAIELRQAAGVHARGRSRWQSPSGGLPSEVVEELRHSLETIVSSLALLSGQGRSLRERTGADLARAEAERATWLAEAILVLGEDPTLHREPTELRELVRRVAAELEPERRLLGVRLTLSLAEVERPLVADAGLLRLAVAGLLRAFGELAAGSARPEAGHGVEVRLAHGPLGDAVLAIRHAGVVLPESLAVRFFDVEHVERPGGRRSAVGAAVAGRVAELHGGTAEVLDGRSGFEARLSIPYAGE